MMRERVARFLMAWIVRALEKSNEKKAQKSWRDVLKELHQKREKLLSDPSTSQEELDNVEEKIRGVQYLVQHG